MKDERRRERAEAESAARAAAKDLGLEVVEFAFHSRGRHSQLRIDIDRPGSKGVGLADCEQLSRVLDELLDHLEIFEAPYELQVSSPGIDRPIRSDDDIRRNSGRLVRLTFSDESGKVREITGTLVGAEGPMAVRLLGEHGEISIPRDAIVLMKQEVTTAGARRNDA